MWQGARPNTKPFIVLDSVSKTNESERAFCTQRLSDTHRIVAGDTVREVLGKKNLGNVLAWCSPVSVDGGTKIPVRGLSVEAHKVILLEDNND